MDYESGMMQSSYVKVEVFNNENEKAVLTVNPVGQFNPGGCEAFASIKKDQILAVTTVEELYEYLLKRIVFENLETTAGDIPSFTVAGVLEYTRELEENEENDWWLPYFRRMDKKVAEFHDDLLAKCATLENIDRVIVHQYHAASGELCDFVDYTCCPEGDDEETIRSFFEDTLSADSDIDEIMSFFEDGYFYGHGYECDETVTVDFKGGTFDKAMTISSIY